MDENSEFAAVKIASNQLVPWPRVAAVGAMVAFSLPTLYSFRHAFEKRMLKGGLDFGLTCTIRGHKNQRPQYGDGGSLSYRQKELLKTFSC